MSGIHDAATAVRGTAHRVTRQRVQHAVIAVVKSVGTGSGGFKVSVPDSGFAIDADDLLVGSAVAQYDEDYGIEEGDSLALVPLENGDYVAVAVLGKLDTSPRTEQTTVASFTGTVVISATTESGANTIVTAPEFTPPEAGTVYSILFFSPCVQVAADDSIEFYLFEDGDSIGRIGKATNGATGNPSEEPVYLLARRTPTVEPHIYSIRACRDGANGSVRAGSGGSGSYRPGYIVVQKVGG